MLGSNQWAFAWVLSLTQQEVRSAEQVGSNEINQVFRVSLDSESVFLKVGPNLQREYKRLQWLQDRLPCPRPVGFTSHGAEDALLISAIEGADLAFLSKSLPVQVIITRLANALKLVHETNISDWPFDKTDGGVLVHSDACLPNFLFQGDRLTAFIDVGDMTVGDPETDRAAAVWSLHYNLGPGHGLPFLQEYGCKDANEREVERLRRKYEKN